MITLKKGNLITAMIAGRVENVMQGCNCFHGSDGGFARLLWDSFPQARYGKERNHEAGDWKVFGTYSTHEIDYYTTYEEMDLVKKHIDPINVINAYTQYEGGANFMLSAFSVILKDINKEYAGKTIAIPRIGAGIGGGDWLAIENALLDFAPDVNWEVYVL